MLIRSEQVDTLSNYMLRSFVDRMAEYIRSRFVRQTANVSDDELRETIQRGIKRADSYGVTDEADVKRYLEYVASYGDDFDSSEWAAPVLAQSALGTAKMNDLDAANICRLSGGG